MILLDLSGSNIADVESASLSKRKGMKSLLNLQTFKLLSCKHLKLSNKWETTLCDMYDTSCKLVRYTLHTLGFFAKLLLYKQTASTQKFHKIL